jgi:DNA-binding FadR family transcriptional regulator
MTKKLLNFEFKNNRISDQIADYLKQAILSGNLKPGDKLPPETEIAVQFKVSKMSIRDALLKMETEGLIKKQRGVSGGSYIAQPLLSKIGDSVWNSYRFGSLSDFEIADFRQFLEPEIIKRAVSYHTEEDLSAMRANIEFCKLAASRGKHDNVKQIDFHLLIAHACHNCMISAVMEAVIDVFKVIIQDIHLTEKEHAQDLKFNKQFYECLQMHDPQEAVKLMGEHFELTKKYFKQFKGKPKTENHKPSFF